MTPKELIEKAHAHYLAAGIAAEKENEVGPAEYEVVRGLVQDHLEIARNYLSALLPHGKREELEALLQTCGPQERSRVEELLRTWDYWWPAE